MVQTFMLLKQILTVAHGANFYVIETNFDSGCELKLLLSDHVRYLDDLTRSSVK